MINNENDELKIEIKSEAYPGGVPYFVKNNSGYLNEIASVHKVIAMNNYMPDVADVYFKNISMNFIEQLMALHREWFPVPYYYEYFSNFLQNKENCIAIGGFIKLKGEEYLIGK